jgi:hypothetical protein
MGQLSSKRRNNLPDSKFAIPADRSYPIDTLARARNALARVVQHGSPAEKAAVRKKVAEKFPGIVQSKGPNAKKTRRG